MKLQIEVPLEAQEDGKSGKSDASDQECVYERRRAGVACRAIRNTGVKENRQVAENSVPSGVQEGMKTGIEGGGSVEMEPPDGGWGWVVAFASGVIMSIIPVMNACFGVLFSRYLLLAGVSSTTTAWIFNIFTFLLYGAGILARPLSLEFGERKIGITGSLLASLGFTITAFAPAPEFLFFSFSVLCGFGGGIMIPLCFTLVSSYFTRRRGVANAIISCFEGCGQICVPPLLTLLQGTFADRGATLIFSGLVLQCCLAATTFHSFERNTKPSSARFTEQSNKEMKPQSTSHTRNSTSTSQPLIFVRVARSVWSDLGILRSRRACIITMTGSLAVCSIFNFLMMVPFALQDVGFSLEFSAWCLSSLAVSSLIAGSLVSALTDWPFFRIRLFYISGFVVMFTMNAVFPLVWSQGWLFALLVAYGAGMGIILGLIPLVVIDVMGLDRLAPVLGTFSLMSGVAFVAFGPILGVIRDASGSYPVSIWCNAGLVGCSVILWALMGKATSWDNARREEGCPNL